MGLEDRRRATMQRLLHEAQDDRLTASELRHKYSEPEPASPRLRPTLSRPGMRMGSPRPSANAMRCWACSTALRDPGAAFFACGACGALNGSEPHHLHALDGCCLRGACRRLTQHGRTTAMLTSMAIGTVIVGGFRCLLPYLCDAASAWTSASLLHTLLACWLAAGTVVNFAAVRLAGPGFVVEECCPLRRGGGEMPCDGLEDGHLSELSRLIAERGDMPLRGWRKCGEMGLSMPPRSSFCQHCARIVRRKEHHCAFVNCCIGHANHHYYLRLLAFVVVSCLYVCVAAMYVLYVHGGVALHSSEQLQHEVGAAMVGIYALLGVHPPSDVAIGNIGNPGPGPTGAGAPAGAVQAATPTLAASSPRLSVVIGGFLRLQLALLASLTREGAMILSVWAISLTGLAITAPLLIMHVRNLRRGLTYAESCHKPPPTDFDLGAAANCRAVFGRGLCACLLHALPLPRQPVGDGISFACRPLPRRV